MWRLKRRPGPSLVPEESLYSSSPAVSESRRAFKYALLSVGGVSTSDALNFPWILGWRDVAAAGAAALRVRALTSVPGDED